MQSHEIDFKIIGKDIQIVEVELDPQETVIAEAGAMLYMDDYIDFQTRMGDGSDANEGFLSKMVKAGARFITGESIFMTHFSNQGRQKAKVAFSAPYPGTIVPLDLKNCFRNEIIVQKDGFLCAALGTKLTAFLNKKLGSGLVGGEGFILQKLTGDGMAFIHAGGTIIEKELHGETLRVDTGCVVAFESSINFDVQRSGGLKSMIFGGEGIFLATLQGTGKVWLQSMPFSKLVRAIAPYGKNSGKGQSSILGSLLED